MRFPKPKRSMVKGSEVGEGIMWWFVGFQCEVERCQTCDAMEVWGYVSEATTCFWEPCSDVKILNFYNSFGKLCCFWAIFDVLGSW
jgi:hypothetical protein